MITELNKENLYFLKAEDSNYGYDIDEIVSDKNELLRFKDSGLFFTDETTVGEVKNKLMEITGLKSEEIIWGESAKDAFTKLELKSEEEFLSQSYYDILLNYDWQIFRNIYIATGLELSNQIEILDLIP